MNFNDKQLDRVLDNLSPELTPQRDLWVDIEPRLEDRPQHHAGLRTPVWAIAVSLLLCVSVVWWQVGDRPAGQSAVPLPDQLVDADFPRQWAEQQQAYATEIRSLSRMISDLEDRQKLILPDGIQQGLSGILAAEHSISKAIMQRPQSDLLTRKLSEVQAIHVSLLRRVVAEAV